MRPSTSIRNDPRPVIRIGAPGPTRRLRRIVAIVAVLIVVVGLTLRISGVPVPRWLGMRSLFLLLFLTNVAWWSLADEAIRSLVRHPRGRAISRGLLGVTLTALALPMLGMVLAGRLPTMVDWPIWLASGFQLWHMGLVVLGLIATVVGYTAWGLW